VDKEVSPPPPSHFGGIHFSQFPGNAGRRSFHSTKLTISDHDAFEKGARGLHTSYSVLTYSFVIYSMVR
jgi:hypothetical protein